MSSSCQRILQVLAAGAVVAVWFIAVSFAWKNSSSGGGDSHSRAEEVARQVSDVGNLSQGCRKLAADLVEAETRAKVATKRPTWHMFLEQRDAVASQWLEAGCPERVLPGIAFGAADAARAIVNDRGRS